MHVGSTAVCSPPPTDTDIDFCVLCEDEGEDDSFFCYLLDNGWKYDKSYDGANFTSFRKDCFNLIVTSEEKFYNAFVLATTECKKYNVTNKDDRIDIHNKWFEYYDIDPMKAQHEIPF